MKAIFRAKTYFNLGTRYEVVGSTNKAIILELKNKKQVAYQVIDYCEDYPETIDGLEKLNVYRTRSKRFAEKDFARRNQLKTK